MVPQWRIFNDRYSILFTVSTTHNRLTAVEHLGRGVLWFRYVLQLLYITRHPSTVYTLVPPQNHFVRFQFLTFVCEFCAIASDHRCTYLASTLFTSTHTLTTMSPYVWFKLVCACGRRCRFVPLAGWYRRTPWGDTSRLGMEPRGRRADNASTSRTTARVLSPLTPATSTLRKTSLARPVRPYCGITFMKLYLWPHTNKCHMYVRCFVSSWHWQWFSLY